MALSETSRKKGEKKREGGEESYKGSQKIEKGNVLKMEGAMDSEGIKKKRENGEGVRKLRSNSIIKNTG